MNNKGLTLIEVITSFTLTSIIVIILLNTLLLIKNIYVHDDTKSYLLIKQSNLSKIMNTSFGINSLDSYEECSDSSFCYSFSFADGATKKLVVDETNKIIKFDKFVYKINATSTFGEKNVYKETLSGSSGQPYDSFLIIKVVINDNLFNNEDFGINFVYPYNSIQTPL